MAREKSEAKNGRRKLKGMQRCSVMLQLAQRRVWGGLRLCVLVWLGVVIGWRWSHGCELSCKSYRFEMGTTVRVLHTNNRLVMKVTEVCLFRESLDRILRIRSVYSTEYMGGSI